MHEKITITGDIGSGKSIISRMLADRLDCAVYSSGSLQRKIADELGMNTLELNEYALHHPEIDTRMDEYAKELGKLRHTCIVDSRMAWFHIPESFKVYLQVDVRIAAERILADTKRKSEFYSNLKEAEAHIRRRRVAEVERYNLRYGQDLLNLNNYDLVLNSSRTEPLEIVMHIFDSFKEWEDRK